MADGKGGWVGDALLRLGGALLLATVWLAARALARSPTLVLQHRPAWSDAALATWTVIGASGGVVLLLLGRHVFDRVEIASRWANTPARDAAAAQNRPPTSTP